MGFFRTIWKGLKGVGKWAVNHPETVSTGISIFDARRRNKANSPSLYEKDHTLSNLSEQLHQLAETLDHEISAVRNDINTVASDLQQEYTTRLEALSQQVEEIRIAQNRQALALKRSVFIFSSLICALTVCVVLLFVL